MKYITYFALVIVANAINVGSKEPCEYEDTGFGCQLISKYSLEGPFLCEPIPEDKFFDAGCRSWSSLAEKKNHNTENK